MWSVVVAMALLVPAQAEASPIEAPSAAARPRSAGGIFSGVRARPEARDANANESTRARAPGDVLQWSSSPVRQPRTIPRPQASIVFPNIGPNVTLPPRAAGVRGSNYTSPTLRTQTRRASVRW